MTWPQRFPSNSVGSQFGWRTFQGKQTFHYGRDQPAGVGAIHRAHANGKVLLWGHDRVYGFYLVVEYDGAPGIRHHIHQLQGGGRPQATTRFKKGDQLGLVGDPLLSVPITDRWKHATYCGSLYSTGSHSHEEVRTAPQIDAAIDPAGTQASNIWKTIETTQVAADEVRPLVEQDHFLMPVVVISTNTDHHIAVTDLNKFWLDTKDANEVWMYGTASGQFNTGKSYKADDAGVRQAIRDSGHELTAWRYNGLKAAVQARAKQ